MKIKIKILLAQIAPLFIYLFIYLFLSKVMTQKLKGK
jgi:hypothetical protein